MPNPPWTHNSVVQMTIIASCIGSQVVNTFHFEASEMREGLLTDDLQAQNFSAALVDEWIASNMTSWRAIHNGEYVVSLIKGQVIERPGSFRHKLTPIERPLTTNNAGTGTGNVENAATCVVMRWRTPQAGKSSRGRSYIGPVPSTWQDNGMMTVPNRAPFEAFATTHNNVWGASGTASVDAVHCIYSRPYNFGEYQYASRKTGQLEVVTPVEYAGNSTFVTGWSFDPVLRSQRRRTLGVGG